MIPGYIEEKVRVAPATLRRQRLLVLMLGLACFSLACYGIAWNRTHAAEVTEGDALRLLNTAHTDSEKKQAMAAVYDRVAEMIAALGAKAKCEGMVGTYGRAHLKNVAEVATETLTAATKGGK